jgi:hypothetical protein
VSPLTVDQTRVMYNIDKGLDPCTGVSAHRTNRRFDAAVQGLKRRGLVCYARAARMWVLTAQGEDFARSMEVTQ